MEFFFAPTPKRWKTLCRDRPHLSIDRFNTRLGTLGINLWYHTSNEPASDRLTLKTTTSGGAFYGRLYRITAAEGRCQTARDNTYFLFGAKRPEPRVAGVGIFGWSASRVEVKETCGRVTPYETHYDNNNNHNNIIITLCAISKLCVIRWGRSRNVRRHVSFDAARTRLRTTYIMTIYNIITLLLLLCSPRARARTGNGGKEHSHARYIVMIAFSLLFIAGIYGVSEDVV